MREDPSLREVRMEPERESEFFFDWPMGSELYMWPMAAFVGLELKGWPLGGLNVGFRVVSRQAQARNSRKVQP